MLLHVSRQRTGSHEAASQQPIFYRTCCQTDDLSPQGPGSNMGRPRPPLHLGAAFYFNNLPISCPQERALSICLGLAHSRKIRVQWVPAALGNHQLDIVGTVASARSHNIQAHLVLQRTHYCSAILATRALRRCGTNSHSTRARPCSTSQVFAASHSGTWS